MTRVSINHLKHVQRLFVILRVVGAPRRGHSPFSQWVCEWPRGPLSQEAPLGWLMAGAGNSGGLLERRLPWPLPVAWASSQQGGHVPRTRLRGGHQREAVLSLVTSSHSVPSAALGDLEVAETVPTSGVGVCLHFLFGELLEMALWSFCRTQSARGRAAARRREFCRPQHGARTHPDRPADVSAPMPGRRWPPPPRVPNGQQRGLRLPVGWVCHLGGKRLLFPHSWLARRPVGVSGVRASRAPSSSFSPVSPRLSLSLSLVPPSPGLPPLPLWCLGPAETPLEAAPSWNSAPGTAVSPSLLRASVCVPVKWAHRDDRALVLLGAFSAV